MKFVSDPPTAVKVRKMKERVRWQEPAIAERGIDQTRLVLDGYEDTPEFSFMVVGDSGAGAHRGHNPQRRVAEQMLAHSQECRFVLHTGDVIYLVGSSEYYLKNFIEPYREFLVNGDRPEQIAYNQMVFSLPILPVPGNHDYYDLPFTFGLLAHVTSPLRRLLQSRLDLDIGLYGSCQGKIYAQAFLDYLQALGQGDLLRHLDQHYTAKTDSGYCLRYQPGQFTRLPNRYYTFRHGGIDFFALDSNTFNAPLPLPETQAGENYRRQLENRLNELEQQKAQIMEASTKLSYEQPAESEQLDDLRTKVQQLEEVQMDIQKQLAANKPHAIDQEQLDWLQQRLVESWFTDGVRGRVIYFHHPPYVTEATKWYQGQTLAVRRRLRQVLDNVAAKVGKQKGDRPTVDLVLNGHAHCLEYLQTTNTGHADAQMNWIVCGGSGFSLRRQRSEGAELMEEFFDEDTYYDKDSHPVCVAKSKLFVGRNGSGSQKRRPYSFIRIDVKDGNPPRFVIRPYISERYRGDWRDYATDPFVIR